MQYAVLGHAQRQVQKIARIVSAYATSSSWMLHMKDTNGRRGMRRRETMSAGGWTCLRTGCLCPGQQSDKRGTKEHTAGQS